MCIYVTKNQKFRESKKPIYVYKVLRCDIVNGKESWFTPVMGMPMLHMDSNEILTATGVVRRQRAAVNLTTKTRSGELTELPCYAIGRGVIHAYRSLYDAKVQKDRYISTYCTRPRSYHIFKMVIEPGTRYIRDINNVQIAAKSMKIIGEIKQ